MQANVSMCVFRLCTCLDAFAPQDRSIRSLQRESSAAYEDACMHRLYADGMMQLMLQMEGRWKDQKGSLYTLRIDGKDTLAVCTTRPTGKVVHTTGLIRVVHVPGIWRGTCSRVVWGTGTRIRYTLGHLDEQSLKWQSCTAAPFFWERLPCATIVKLRFLWHKRRTERLVCKQVHNSRVSSRCRRTESALASAGSMPTA